LFYIICTFLYWNPGSAPEYHRGININFKGTGIFDLKRTQIYTHTFAWSEVIVKIEFWSCLYCVESVCITCGSEQDTLYKIIYTKMCIWCKTMCLIPHNLTTTILFLTQLWELLYTYHVIKQCTEKETTSLSNFSLTIKLNYLHDLNIMFQCLLHLNMYIYI
jgi:hypothetical protein